VSSALRTPITVWYPQDALSVPGRQLVFKRHGSLSIARLQRAACIYGFSWALVSYRLGPNAECPMPPRFTRYFMSETRRQWYHSEHYK
jgi:hypothetical protein